jgi:hypothetical protein
MQRAESGVPTDEGDGSKVSRVAAGAEWRTVMSDRVTSIENYCQTVLQSQVLYKSNSGSLNLLRICPRFAPIVKHV